MMMRTLMDDFYDLRESDAFLYNMALDSAISLVNQCHQLSPLDVLDRVQVGLEHIRSLADSEEERRAMDDALMMVDMRKEEIVKV